MPRWFPMRLPQVTMGFNNSNGRMNWMIWGTTIGIYIYIHIDIYIYIYTYVYI